MRLRASSRLAPPIALAACAFVALPTPPVAWAGEGEGAPAEEGFERFEDLSLSIRFPRAFEDLARSPLSNEQRQAQWRCTLGASVLEVNLWALAIEEFRFEDPEDVTELVAENRSDPARGGRVDFAFAKSELASGPFGVTPYASVAEAPLLEGPPGGEVRTVGRLHVLSGLLPKHGYFVEVSCRPAPDAAGETVVLDFLRKGVAYEGQARDSKWTDEEARARWLRDAPPATHEKMEEPLRTEHYIVLTNSSGGAAFAKKMEECYRKIQKTFPFEELPDRRLMPVFLFRTADEYYDYYAAIADTPRGQAKKSKGHSWRDYYATWYEAPNDPVHVHEATHQIFKNRLRLGGGGSWFQEGVAEYMSSSRNDRNEAAGVVKRGKSTPLADFVKIPNLLGSNPLSTGGVGQDAGDLYRQAALLVEFLRESKWGKAKFPAYLEAVGRVPRSDGPAIEDAVRSVYGVDLAGLDEEFTKYCLRR